nr:hypothetical protein [Tanacetum cinerariifolium]
SPIPTASSPVPTACLNGSSEISSEARLVSKRVSHQEESPSLDNILSLTNRIHKDHPKSQIIGPVDTPIQTRHKSKMVEEQKPKRVSDALQDPSWVEAMQEELLQFKIQKVWTLVDCPKGVRPIGTKRVLKNKKDERGIVKLRIKQYFQVQDYALWDVIENENSFKPVPRTSTNADGTSTLTIPGLVTTEEKAQKNNDVKARSKLLMALPNEHLLTFSQYKDAKTLFEAIQARFGGNDATNKTQRTLLKQMYKNSNAPSIESLDSIFNRNKADLDTMSIDDLYNTFKIVEQEVKRTVVSRSLNMAFLSSPGSTNEVDTASIQVSAANTPVSIVSSLNNTANLSDATVYAFLANQPNGSQLVHEDLEKIHEDDQEEIDLKWQLALLSIRVRRSPRNQESRPRNQDSSRKTMIMEDTSFKAMVVIDGAGFDRSYMVDDDVPTNMAFMAFLDS